MIKLHDIRSLDDITKATPEHVNYIKSLYDSSAKFYLKQHKDWYLNDRFVRGEHWIAYNKTLNKIQAIPVSQGEVRRTINKIRSQLRGIKNFIKRSQPRFEVHPNAADDAAYEEAEGKNKILQNLFRVRQIKKKMTSLVINGMKYSVGFWEAGVIKRDGKEMIDLWTESSYDIIPDPYAKNLQDCRFIFKTAVKPVEDLLANKDYVIKDKNITDNRKAAADYKNILELERGNAEADSNKTLETAVVKELWMKWYDGERVRVKVLTIIGNNIARMYEPKYRRYPFFSYTPETNDETIFNQPWIKDLISVNKSLDKTVSQVESYIQRMLAGKYLIKRGVEVSSITDKGAEKIYYKGQVPPKQMDLQPLPSTPFVFIESLERWIEELGGVREASLGGIEALQSADAGTVAEPIENLELILQEVGEFFLELIADYQMTTEEIVEDNASVKFVGSNGLATEGAISINGEDSVKVTIAPEIGYSDSSRKEWTMRLAESGLIDPQTLLEQFNFSNIGDIVERVEKQKEEEFKKEMVKQRESHRTDGDGPQDTADYADQENMQMAAGQEVPLTPKALWTPEHLELHNAFIQENPDAYNQNKQLFDAHLGAEEQYQ